MRKLSYMLVVWSQYNKQTICHKIYTSNAKFSLSSLRFCIFPFLGCVLPRIQNDTTHKYLWSEKWNWIVFHFCHFFVSSSSTIFYDLLMVMSILKANFYSPIRLGPFGEFNLTQSCIGSNDARFDCSGN